MSPTTVPHPAPMDRSSTDTTQAMAQTPSAPDIIRTPDDYVRRLQGWHDQRYHVLSPVTNFSGLPAHMGLVPSMVTIDPDPAHGEVYQDKLFCGADEVAPAKPGLAKIAQAGGMSIKTERTDPRSIAHYWEVRATLRWVGLDGTPQEIDATAEYDLRDGSPRVLKMEDAARRNKRDATAQVLGARTYGLRGCEARAINAAIRQFGIRQKYHKADLLKPFVVVRVVFVPDMSDPGVRRQVTERALAGSTQLYPSDAPTRGAHPDVIDVIGTTISGAVGESSQTAPPDAAPTTRELLGVRHDMEAGVYDLTLDGGEVVLTRDSAVAQAAMAAKKAGQRVTLGFEERDGETVVISVTSAAAAPSTATEADPGAGVLVDRVEVVKGAKNGNAWTRYDVTFSNGQVVSTFSGPLAQLIDEAKAKQARVTFTASPNGDYHDKLETLTLVDHRQATLPMAEGRY